MKIVSIGEILWDVIGNDEYLGGAALNFSAHAARLGYTVLFVSAVGNDERGRRALKQMSGMGLPTRFVHTVPTHPTGIVTVELDSAGQPKFTLHHPAAYDVPELSKSELVELFTPQPDWVYFGTLFQMSLQAKALTYRLLNSAAGALNFYDINLRKEHYNPTLLRELMRQAQVVKMNEEESRSIDQMFGRTSGSLENFCREYAGEFGWISVCVTRGENGCVLLVGDEFVEARGYSVQTRDTVGAGDAFAAAFMHGLSQRWTPSEIADFANRVAALVASRSGGTPPWTLEEARALSSSTNPP